MRIVMLCYFFQENLGFQENHLVREYLESGHEVLVIAPPDDNVFAYYEGQRNKSAGIAKKHISLNYKLVRLPYRRFATKKINPIHGVYAQLNDFKPDLIFIHGLSYNLGECVKYAGKNSKCKIIMDFHGDLSNSASNWISRNVLHRIINRYYLKHYLPSIDQIYAITPASSDFLEKIYEVDAKNIELLPLGSDLKSVKRLNEQDIRRVFRKRMGLSKEEILIFTGGKLEPWKRTDQLIQAVTDLNRSDIHLVVVGSVPDLHAEYERRLTELSTCHPAIHLVGWVDHDEMTSYMLASDIAVFPASQSVIWQQAIAAGLPLIVGELPNQSVAYINRGNIIPLKILDDNSARLADAIQNLADDIHLRRLMSEISTTLAINELDWAKLAQRTLD